MSLKYRPEIDGLRAIAVLAVVVYHAELFFFGNKFFKGGFLGVDVFFVISGYLITSIIVKNAKSENGFSYKEFYLKRARRILPALYSTIILSIPFAWILLLPKAMKEYTGSLISTLLFSSNFWFWFEDSYAAEPSKLKPFLHTWSLAIEEQFYFILPLIIIYIIKKRESKFLIPFSILFIISFIISNIGTVEYPDANFFLLPSRFWELLAGSFLAIIPSASKSKNYLANLGFLGIMISFWLISDKDAHPGIITLPTVVGTSLIIFFINTQGYLYRFLSSSPILLIGKSSYSYYLYHVPVLVFSRLAGLPMTNFNKIILVILSFGLALISYYFIEQPFRYKNTITDKKLKKILIPSSFIFLFFFGFIFSRAGFLNRFGIDLKNSYRYNFKYQGRKCHDYLEPCIIPNPKSTNNVVLVGDSHAGAISGVFGKEIIKKYHYAQYTSSACPHLLGFTIPSRDKNFNLDCQRRAKLFDQYQDKNKNLTIIHLAHYNYWLQGKFDNESGDIGLKTLNTSVSVEEQVFNNINSWLSNGHKVILIIQPPEFPDNPVSPRGLRYISKLKFSSVDKNLVNKRKEKVIKLFQKIKNPNFKMYDPYNLFCNDNFCESLIDGKILYTDADHLSRSGSKFIWDSFKSFLEKEVSL